MKVNAAGYEQPNYKRWSPELIAQFPLPDEYKWYGGGSTHLPHLRREKWVIAVFEPNALGGGVVKGCDEHKTTTQAYPVSTPEEAIALIYNLVLFGETS